MKYAARHHKSFHIELKIILFIDILETSRQATAEENIKYNYLQSTKIRSSNYLLLQMLYIMDKTKVSTIYEKYSR